MSGDERTLTEQEMATLLTETSQASVDMHIEQGWSLVRMFDAIPTEEQKAANRKRNAAGSRRAEELAQERERKFGSRWLWS